MAVFSGIAAPVAALGDTDKLVGVSPTGVDQLPSLAQVRTGLVAGNGALTAASSVALADIASISQSAAAKSATIQQILDAYGLAANDAAPADTDLVAVNQGGVAKTLALSALRTKLDSFGAARTIQATQIALATGAALQLPSQAQLGGVSASFPMLKRNGIALDVRLADDSGYGALFPHFCVGDIRVLATIGDISGPFDTFYFKSNGSGGGNYLSIWKGDLRFTAASNAENGQDLIVSRAAAAVLSIDGSTSGDALGQIKCAGATGAGVAAIGANSPASTLTAPYVWLKFMATDGSQVYVPAWK